MKEIIEALSPYIIELLVTILTIIGGYVGNLYKNKIKNEKTKEIIELTVKYVEQVGKELDSEEKLQLAQKEAISWLNEKGLKINDVELRMLIEATVCEFNKNKK